MTFLRWTTLEHDFNAELPSPATTENNESPLQAMSDRRVGTAHAHARQCVAQSPMSKRRFSSRLPRR